MILFLLLKGVHDGTLYDGSTVLFSYVFLFFVVNKLSQTMKFSFTKCAIFVSLSYNMNWINNIMQTEFYNNKYIFFLFTVLDVLLLCMITDTFKNAQLSTRKKIVALSITLVTSGAILLMEYIVKYVWKNTFWVAAILCIFASIILFYKTPVMKQLLFYMRPKTIIILLVIVFVVANIHTILIMFPPTFLGGYIGTVSIVTLWLQGSILFWYTYKRKAIC